LAVCATCITMLERTASFVSPSRSICPNRRSIRPNRNSLVLNNNGNGNEEFEDSMERRRAKLEALIGKRKEGREEEEPSVLLLSDVLELWKVNANAAPLSSTARSNKEKEIQLLSSLATSDKSLPQLWSLWFGEKGPAPAKQLVDAKALADKGPKHWDEAQQQLLHLISTHGTEWVEPINALANLLFVQGQLQQSKALCELVLSLKPWHFGAVRGLVLVCAGLGDSTSARIWADRRLPPITPRAIPHHNEQQQSSSHRRSTGRYSDATVITERRKAWVQRAVQDAQFSLLQAEQQTRDNFFGQRDDTWAITPPQDHYHHHQDNHEQSYNDNSSLGYQQSGLYPLDDLDDDQQNAWE